MYHKPYVTLGIIVFLIIVTAPSWLNTAGKGFEDIRPLLEKPKGDHCVEDTKWMSANHMELLKEFREMAIRSGERVMAYKSKTYGTYYNASLNTCFECHDYEKFCRKCHEYTETHIYCWTCHTPPGAGE